MTNIISALSLILFGLYGEKLYFANELGLYIHRKYILFSFIGSTVAIIAGGLAILIAYRNANQHKQYRSHKESAPNVSIDSLPIVFVLLAGFLIPAKPLNQASVYQAIRNKDLEGVSVMIFDKNQKKSSLITQLYGTDTTSYTLADWFHVEQMDAEWTFQEGKTLDISGFVANSTDHTFDVRRTIVTCCVIDAQSFGYTVQSALPSYIRNGDFVRIRGNFKIQSASDTTESLIITATSISKAPKPDDPYIYY